MQVHFGIPSAYTLPVMVIMLDMSLFCLALPSVCVIPCLSGLVGKSIT